MARRSASPRTAAVAAAFSPYAWRDLTERMLARRVLAAADRYSVIRLIHSVPGATVGELEPLEPVENGDLRVDVLVQELQRRRWRKSSLDRLCVQLLTALDAWQTQRDALHPRVWGLHDR